MAREPSSRDDVRFIDNFKRLRTEQGLRQADVAEKLQSWGWEYFTQTTLSRLEKLERPLRLGEARALAAIVKRPMSYMLAPTGDVAAMDLLARADREARQASIQLFEALTAVSVARRNLVEVLRRGEQIDPESLGDDGLASRFAQELRSAQGSLRDLEESLSELSPGTQQILDGLADDLDEAREASSEPDDGVNL